MTNSIQTFKASSLKLSNDILDSDSTKAALSELDRTLSNAIVSQTDSKRKFSNLTFADIADFDNSTTEENFVLIKDILIQIIKTLGGTVSDNSSIIDPAYDTVCYVGTQLESPISFHYPLNVTSNYLFRIVDKKFSEPESEHYHSYDNSINQIQNFDNLSRDSSLSVMKHGSTVGYKMYVDSGMNCMPIVENGIIADYDNVAASFSAQNLVMTSNKSTYAISDGDLKSKLDELGESTEAIVFGSTIAEITRDLLRNSFNLKYVGFHPNSNVQLIGNKAFSYKNIEVINFPKTVKNFGKYIFLENNNIRYISYFDTFETKDPSAFSGYGNPTVEKFSAS